jgi:peroxiredoxin
MRSDDLYQLPADLPVPVDDGAAKHLVGLRLPPIALPSTNGSSVRLDQLNVPFTVVYCYPRTGRPDADAPGGTADWNAIPGARGCTPQSCAYRDHYQELRQLGATVYGLSTQTSDYQREAMQRLRLPFALLSDADGKFSASLRLPTFEVEGVRLVKRLTFVIQEGRIVYCVYPVFPPDQDAQRVTTWIREYVA